MSDARELMSKYRDLKGQEMKLRGQFQPLVSDFSRVQEVVNALQWIKEPARKDYKELILRQKDNDDLKETVAVLSAKFRSQAVQGLCEQMGQIEQEAIQIRQALFEICKEALDKVMERELMPLTVLRFLDTDKTWHRRRLLYASKLEGGNLLVRFHEELTQIVPDFRCCNGRDGWVPLVDRDEGLTREVLEVLSQ